MHAPRFQSVLRRLFLDATGTYPDDSPARERPGTLFGSYGPPIGEAAAHDPDAAARRLRSRFAQARLSRPHGPRLTVIRTDDAHHADATTRLGCF